MPEPHADSGDPPHGVDDEPGCAHNLVSQDGTYVSPRRHTRRCILSAQRRGMYTTLFLKHAFGFPSSFSLSLSCVKKSRPIVSAFRYIIPSGLHTCNACSIRIMPHRIIASSAHHTQPIYTEHHNPVPSTLLFCCRCSVHTILVVHHGILYLSFGPRNLASLATSSQDRGHSHLTRPAFHLGLVRGIGGRHLLDLVCHTYLARLLVLVGTL